MAGTILSSGVRNNLLALQQTTSQQAVIQNRLATGKKVNSAIDNPVNFFTNLSLNDRASQFSGLLDGISNGIQTVQAASKGIDAITKLVNQAQSIIKQAQGDATARPKFDGTVAIGGGAVGAKTAKSVALDTVLGGTATAATATTDAQLGLGIAAIAFTITAGDKVYTDTTLTQSSTVEDLVASVNKSGVATASIGDDGKLTIKATTSETVKIGLGAGASPAAALTSAQAGGSNTLIGLLAADATTGKDPVPSDIRTNLVKQFNDLRVQIDQLAKDAGYNGTNLLGGDTLSVIFNEKTGANQNKIDVKGEIVDSDYLGIGTAGTASGQLNFQSDGALAKTSDALIASLTTLRNMASAFSSNLGVIQTRQDFTKNLINVLTTGADNLVLADSNEEGASLLALNTRQQLSQTALSLASQADQSVLRLFG